MNEAVHALLFNFLLFCLFEVFPDSEFNNSGDEGERKRFINWKLHSAFRTFINRKLFFKRNDPGRGGVEPHMTFPPCKMNKVTVKGKGRNSIVNSFFRFRRGFA